MGISFPALCLFLFLFSLLFLHRVKAKDALQVTKDTFKQVNAAAIALVFGIALVQVMRFSSSEAAGGSMISAMAKRRFLPCG
jgi:lactate permease